MTAKIVELGVLDLRDVPALLRHTADDIERGEYGAVSCVAVVVRGTPHIDVLSAGADSGGRAVALLLHAGFLQMAALEEDDPGKP